MPPSFKVVSYDAIGNPLTYNGWNYTWEESRQLATMQNGSQTLEFKYNDSGIRTEKKVNGVATQYHLVGDKVTFETNGTDKIYYTYDTKVEMETVLNKLTKSATVLYWKCFLR